MSAINNIEFETTIKVKSYFDVFGYRGSQIINYHHLNCLSRHLMIKHCHPLITKTSVLYARMTTSLYSPTFSIASVLHK